MKYLLSIALLLGMVGSASAVVEEVVTEEVVIGHGAASTAQAFTTGLVVGGLLMIVLSDEHQACDDLPLKSVQKKGANYFYSVSGCEAEYPKS